MLRAGRFALKLAALATIMSGPALAAPEPQTVTGNSERMTTLAGELIQAFHSTNPNVKIEAVHSRSTSAARALIEGTSNFVVMARPLTVEESRRVRLAHRTDPVSVPIAMDVAAVFVHPRNSLSRITVEQINGILRYRITNWTALEVPFDNPIKHHGLKEHSGSAWIVQARAMNGAGYTLALIKHDTVREVVNAVAEDPLSIGFGPLGYTSGVEVIPVQKDSDSSPIFPTIENVHTRQYPFSHYVYLCFVGQPKGAAKALLRFAVGKEGQQVVERSTTGVFPLPFPDSKD